MDSVFPPIYRLRRMAAATLFLITAMCAVPATAQEISLTPEETEWLNRHQKILIGTVPDWAPISMRDEHGILTGIAGDYLEIFERKLGRKIQVAPELDWPDVLEHARQGKIDTVMLLGQTPDRDKYLNFTGILVELPYVIITRQDSPHIDGIGDLAGKRVAVREQFVSHEWLKQEHPEIVVLPFVRNADALQAVSLGSADAYIGSLADSVFDISNMGLANLEIAANAGFTNNLRIGIRKNSPELTQIFTKIADSITPAERTAIWNRWVAPREEIINPHILYAVGIGLAGIIAVVLAYSYLQMKRAYTATDEKIRTRTAELENTMAELRAGESKYRQIFEQITDYILVMELRENAPPLIVDASESAFRIHGYKREEFIGQPITLLDPEEEKVPKRVDALLHNPSARFEVTHKRKDGSKFIAEVYGKAIALNGKKLIYTIERDITAKKRVETALHESEERNRLLVAYAPVCIHEININGQLISMNRAGLRMMGLAEETEVIGLPYLSAVGESDRERIGELLRKAYDGQASHFEFTSAGNNPRIFKSCFIPIRGERGAVARLMGITEDITEQRIAESELAANEEFFRSVFDGAGAGMAVIDTRSGKFMRVNSMYCSICGYSAAEMMKMTFMEITHHDNLPADLANMERIKSGEISRFSMEKRYIKKDGSAAWVELTVVPLKKENGVIVSHLAVVWDIAARKEAEEALAVSEKRMRLIAENVNDIIYKYRLKPSPRFEYVSPSVAAITGYTPEEHYADPALCMKIIHPDDKWILNKLLSGKGGAGEPVRLRWIHKNGSVVQVEQVNSIEMKDGEAVAVSGIARDITARNAQQEDIAENRRILRALIDSIPEAVLLLDRSCKIKVINKALAGRFGKTPEEVEGIEPWQLLPPELAASRRAMFERVFSTGETVRWSDERAGISFDHAAYPVKNSAGETVFAASISLNTTERKKLEHELRSLHLATESAYRRYRLLASKAPAGLQENNLEGVITYANPKLHEMHGYANGDLLGVKIWALMPEKMRAGFKKYFAELVATQPPPTPFHSRNVRKDGSIIDVEVLWDYIRGEKGELTGFSCIILDVTERNRLEASLREAKEKAEEATKLKDKFVSIVAHDIRAPLSGTLGLLNLISADTANPITEGHRKLVDRLIQVNSLAMHMVEELLSISRLKTGKITVKAFFMQARMAARYAISLHAVQSAEKGVTVENDIPPDLYVYADFHLIAEVLSNLVGNAIKFCNKGDKVTIHSPDPAACVIAVSDTGVGINPNFMPHLFTPDVKTTSAGTASEPGTGLGLPYCADIIKAHGGEIRAESEPGKGATFFIKLPYVQPSVLVVDDDPGARLFVSASLTPAGYKIDGADNGMDALAMTETCSPHLIFTDISMPRMDGYQFLAELRKKPNFADTPVVVITSLGLEEKSRALQAGASDFLEKPVSREALLAAAKKYLP